MADDWIESELQVQREIAKREARKRQERIDNEPRDGRSRIEQLRLRRRNRRSLPQPVALAITEIVTARTNTIVRWDHNGLREEVVQEALLLLLRRETISLQSAGTLATHYRIAAGHEDWLDELHSRLKNNPHRSEAYRLLAQIDFAVRQARRLINRRRSRDRENVIDGIELQIVQDRRYSNLPHADEISRRYVEALRQYAGSDRHRWRDPAAHALARIAVSDLYETHRLVRPGAVYCGEPDDNEG
jgi:hypothetical protein